MAPTVWLEGPRASCSCETRWARSRHGEELLHAPRRLGSVLHAGLSPTSPRHQGVFELQHSLPQGHQAVEKSLLARQESRQLALDLCAQRRCRRSLSACETSASSPASYALADGGSPPRIVRHYRALHDARVLFSARSCRCISCILFLHVVCSTWLDSCDPSSGGQSMSVEKNIVFASGPAISSVEN
jgi:hypothetical protein